MAQDGGFAGHGRDPVHQHLAQLLEYMGGVVLTASRGPGVEHDHVGVAGQGLGHGVLDQLVAVLHLGQDERLGPALGHQGGQEGAVGLDDVAGAGWTLFRLLPGEQLGAGGDDGHPRALERFDAEDPGGEQGREVGRGQAVVVRQDHLAGHHVLAHLAHVLPGEGGGLDLGGLGAGLVHLLDHDDRVAALGQGLASVDGVDLLAQPEFQGAFLAGPEGGAGLDRQAVHGRGVVAGRGEIGVDRLGRDPAQGLHGGNSLRAGQLGPGEGFQEGLAGDRQGLHLQVDVTLHG